MDSITQGLLGAAAAQAVMTRRLGRRAWLYGAVGGMAADLDILIRSNTDPLVAFTYHRHFTHSLVFIPIGGLVCALPWILRRRFRPQARDIVAATTVGYATHALLDAFTSYGTMLWWPFSNARVAWDFVAIIDFVFSLALLVGVVMSARGVTPRPARIALAFCGIYLALGAIQHARAMAQTESLATGRGHTPSRVSALPAPPSNVVWRTFYEADGRMWIANVRTPWFSPARIRPGADAPLVDAQALPEPLRSGPEAMEAYRTFAWFAMGWVGHPPGEPDVLGDLRYTAVPGSAIPLWGIRLRPGAPDPVEPWRYEGDMRRSVIELWRELMGGDNEP